MKQTIFTKDQCVNSCSSPEYLKKENYLGEFKTEFQKQKARENLGITQMSSGNSDYLIFQNLFEMLTYEDIKEPKLAYVVDDNTENYFYIYKDNKWSPANLGKEEATRIFGIPILNQKLIEEYQGELPEEYIKIRSEHDLEGEITKNTYTTSKNGSYVDILFQALRALQSEVSKLKNSFQYGINSYNNTDTALSVMQEGYSENVDEEPLWAIDESELSEEFALESVSQLTPSKNINATNKIYKINGTATWNNTYNIPDAKLITYLTTNNLNVKFNLNDLTINLNDLNIPKCDTNNIMLVISRKVNDLGDNFIWLSVCNYTLDETIAEGYLDGNTLKTSRVLLENSYNINSVDFTDITLSKFKLYSKYQDFSDSVLPSKPDDQSYKYNVAHITIRSVKNFSTLWSIKAQLQNNELIFVEQKEGEYESGLYIKNNNNIIALGGNSGGIIDEGPSTKPDDPVKPPTQTTMTKEELIRLLQELGLVYIEGDTINEDTIYHISNIGDLTFIHEDSGNTYKVSVDAYGNLISSKVPEHTLEEQLKANNVTLTQSNRGVIGQLGLAEYKKLNSAITLSNDLRLYADRLKIGAFYAPKGELTTYGCSHAYIELENTSDKDINLQGCYLHFVKPSINNDFIVKHLALNGVIPAGGTYLIRGKQYSDISDSNTFIKVNTFDQEWYDNKELIDLTYSPEGSYGFCITYGNQNLIAKSQLVSTNNNTQLDSSKSKYLYDSSFIDAVYFNKCIENGSDQAYWTGNKLQMSCNDPNVIFKNTFELDPAKQAFQGLTERDSSRVRNNNKTDYYYIPLANEYLSFPKSDEVYPVSKFTPKASFEHKNVCTDKTKMDMNKPNMVTCSFGIDAFKTRCFNWISAGLFDEYVWIKNEEQWLQFESYKPGSEKVDITHGSWSRKKFSEEINNVIYSRITGRFPADNTQFTSHKCIITTNSTVSSPTTYTYIVGRADKNGNPDLEHCSEEYTFTLYPSTYTPRIYQVTDQQGFHWVEYQVWNAVAKQLETQIKSDCGGKNVIPVLLNTGDMTQNGTRINEWLDYYNAGKNLFKQYEQVNVVGNNDLCGTIPTELGTGDDPGKSNSYYFHLFYCYEIPYGISNADKMTPIINNKYVPSLYYIDFANDRLLLVNSEITETNCKEWYNLIYNGNTVNAYTGWEITQNTPKYHGDFTSIYTMLYYMTDTSKRITAACHEMPFTVITNENLNIKETNSKSRSLSGTNNSLVGSHLNQLSVNDIKANYWFSRLLEFRHVKLCLGGHKHTYAVTYPVREYYWYGNNYQQNSLENGPMNMTDTLANDDITFIQNDINYSKRPLLTKRDIPEVSGIIPAFTYVSEFKQGAAGHTDGVVYFMCQASGFKLKSNKELPSVDQRFSQFLPKSTINDNTGAYEAANEQQSPMYAIIDIKDNYTITLLKLLNIQLTKRVNNIDTYVLLTPFEYGTEDISIQHLSDVKDLYGQWKEGINSLMTI